MEEKAHLIAQGFNMLDVLPSMSHNVFFFLLMSLILKHNKTI